MTRSLDEIRALLGLDADETLVVEATLPPPALGIGHGYADAQRGFAKATLDAMLAQPHFTDDSELADRLGIGAARWDRDGWIVVLDNASVAASHGAAALVPELGWVLDTRGEAVVVLSSPVRRVVVGKHGEILVVAIGRRVEMSEASLAASAKPTGSATSQHLAALVDELAGAAEEPIALEYAELVVRDVGRLSLAVDEAARVCLDRFLHPRLRAALPAPDLLVERWSFAPANSSAEMLVRARIDAALQLAGARALWPSSVADLAREAARAGLLDLDDALADIKDGQAEIERAALQYLDSLGLQGSGRDPTLFGPLAADRGQPTDPALWIALAGRAAAARRGLDDAAIEHDEWGYSIVTATSRVRIVAFDEGSARVELPRAALDGVDAVTGVRLVREASEEDGFVTTVLELIGDAMVDDTANVVLGVDSFRDVDADDVDTDFADSIVDPVASWLRARTTGGSLNLMREEVAALRSTARGRRVAERLGVHEATLVTPTQAPPAAVPLADRRVAAVVIPRIVDNLHYRGAEIRARLTPTQRKMVASSLLAVRDNVGDAEAVAETVVAALSRVDWLAIELAGALKSAAAVTRRGGPAQRTPDVEALKAEVVKLAELLAVDDDDA